MGPKWRFSHRKYLRVQKAGYDNDNSFQKPPIQYSKFWWFFPPSSGGTAMKKKVGQQKEIMRSVSESIFLISKFSEAYTEFVIAWQ